MKVIVNSTPLIALSLIGRIDLLQQLFTEIIVPEAVYDEVVTYGLGRAGANAVAQANWITIVTPTVKTTLEPLLLGLDPGEMEVLLLAREVAPDWVLIDERLGRRVAKALKLPLKGTLGILLAAVVAGLMHEQEALTAMMEMIAGGIRISPRWQNWLQDELDKLEKEPDR